MSENTKTIIEHPAIVKRLQSAFPNALSHDVSLTLARLPVSRFEPSPDDIGAIRVSGEVIHIPYRIYSPEPIEASLVGLNSRNISILACIYTRHHDGFVRLKYVEKLFNQDDVWVSPFVLQLLGEYVIEIIEVIAQNTKVLPLKSYDKFRKENPAFICLLKYRIVSYWNCYYRYRFPNIKYYIGFQVADTLGIWEKGDLRRLLAR